jgi:hypothetical protein
MSDEPVISFPRTTSKGITIYSEYSGLVPDGELLGHYVIGPYGQCEICDADGTQLNLQKIISRDGPLSHTLSDGAGTPIFRNLTPKGELIGFYRLGLQNERIPCDTDGRTGSLLDQQRVAPLNPDPHVLSNGMRMYSNLTAYGQIIGHYRLEEHGNEVQQVMCDAIGVTGTELDRDAVKFAPIPHDSMAIEGEDIFTDCSSDGQVRCYYRLGPREVGNAYHKRIMCDFTGMPLGRQAAIGSLTQHAAMLIRFKDNRIQNEMSDIPYMKHLVNTINAKNPALNIVFYDGGQRKNRYDFFNAPLQNRLQNCSKELKGFSKSDFHGMFIANISGEGHYIAGSHYQAGDESSIIIVDALNPKGSGVAQRDILTLADFTDKSMINHAAHITLEALQGF